MITIQGDKWNIVFTTRVIDKGLVEKSGYTDSSINKIAIEVTSLLREQTPEYCENPDVYILCTIRHEIIHAFLFSCGLSYSTNNTAWAMNEEMVDFFASNNAKLQVIFQKAEKEYYAFKENAYKNIERTRKRYGVV